MRRSNIFNGTFVIVLFFIFFISCNYSIHAGFAETENGLYYKLLNIGDGERYAMPKDYVTAQIIIKTEKDSVLYETKKIGLEGTVTFILPEKFTYKKDYREGFLYLNEGDSAVFITDARAIFLDKNKTKIPIGLHPESNLYVGVKVVKISSPEEQVAAAQLEKEKLEKGEFEEKRILDKYLVENKIEVAPVANGIYHIVLSEGRGVSVDAGRVALLYYKGLFLNGRCFDSSFESQPFEYILGAEEQLMPGLVAGVRKMREGEKAKFIIPSHLAFGSAGSSTGMIPPFTTLVYEVELLKVQ